MKQKEKKFTNEQMQVVEQIKKSLDEFIRTSNEALSVSYSETLIDEEKAFVACVEYPAFTQKIIYRVMFISNVIDFKFSFSGAQRDYGLYEIFNLFDIDDFNVYCYDELETSHEVSEAINEINSVTHKYMQYLEEASKSENQELLYQQHKEDLKSIIDDDKDIEESIEYAEAIDITNPFYSYADIESPKKLYKKLKKQNAKGRLTTKYEKRLLAYLESGKSLPVRNVEKNKKREKSYSRAKIKVNAVIISATVAITLLVCILIKMLLFADALCAEGVGFENLVASIIIGMFFSFANISLFGSRLIHKFMSVEAGSYAEEKYERENGGVFGKKGNLISSVVLYVITIAAFLMFAFSSYGFYDNEVKYMETAFSGVETISYDEMTVYRVLGYYDEDNNYYTNENSYVLAGENGEFLYLSEIEQNGESEKMVLSICEKYDKPITAVESDSDIPGYIDYEE